MTIARRSLRVLAAAMIVSISTPALAQTVEAEVLFREGKRLMKEGKIEEACDKLDASERLESSVGTLLNLADCREKLGQLATAWATFRKAAVAAKAKTDANRGAEAKRRASALEPRLAYLTISVPDRSRLDGLTIKRNTALVDSAVWNVAVPIDPGEYEITGQAPDHEPWSTRLEITTDGQKASVVVPRFKHVEAQPKPPVAEQQPPKPVVVKDPSKPTKPVVVKDPPKPTKAVAVKRPPEAEDDERETERPRRPGTFTGQRKAAIAVAAVGLLGIAGGTVFGMKASDLEQQSDAICPTASCGDARAVQLNEDAKSDALYANIGFGVGAVALGGAIALWFLGAPTVHGEAVSLTPIATRGEVGFALGGQF